MLKAFSLVSTASIALMSLSLFMPLIPMPKVYLMKNQNFQQMTKPTSSQSSTQANAFKKLMKRI